MEGEREGGGEAYKTSYEYIFYSNRPILWRDKKSERGGRERGREVGKEGGI